MEPKENIGIIGAASFVGERLLPLLQDEGYHITLFSRKGGDGTVSLKETSAIKEKIALWICLAPIWTLPEHFPLLETASGTRLIALSSTSRLTKLDSPDRSDRELAARLIKAERGVKAWAKTNDCFLTIFQPTMIYGHGRDENITAIAKLIKKFGVFPLFGPGSGLRQPVHVDDVAGACFEAIKAPALPQSTYILSGGTVLTYRQMVEKIFSALGKKKRFFNCPLFIVHLAVRMVTLFPSYKGLTAEVAIRMNKDQHFDHKDAAKDLRFAPRSFEPSGNDLEA